MKRLIPIFALLLALISRAPAATTNLLSELPSTNSFKASDTVLLNIYNGSTYTTKMGALGQVFSNLARILGLVDSNNVPGFGSETNALKASTNYANTKDAETLASAMAYADSLGGGSGGVSSNFVYGSISNKFRPTIPFPLSGPLYLFGDSQMAGNNLAVTNYTDGASYLLPAYRIESYIATNGSRALSISNNAVGGTMIGWTTNSNAGTYFTRSAFNTWGNVSLSWTGVVASMIGFNDTSFHSTNGVIFLGTWRRAYEAWIARALIDEFFGVSTAGYTAASNSGNDTPGWSTTSTADSFTTSDRAAIPFYPTGWTPSTRARIGLVNGQFLSFTANGKKAVGLFFETDPNGGDVTVTLNGATVGTFNTAGTNYNSFKFPMVVWLDNLPPAVSITVVAASGAGKTNYWLAGGSVSARTYGDKRNRTIIVGGPSGNILAQTPASYQTEMTRQAEAAAGAFKNYPIYFAAPQQRWNNALHQDPGDVAHLTPLGNLACAEAFLDAKAPRPSLSDTVIDCSGWQGNSTGYALTSGGRLKTISFDGGLSATITDTSTNLNIALPGGTNGSGGIGGFQFKTGSYTTTSSDAFIWAHGGATISLGTNLSANSFRTVIRAVAGNATVQMQGGGPSLVDLSQGSTVSSITIPTTNGMSFYYPGSYSTNWYLELKER